MSAKDRENASKSLLSSNIPEETMSKPLLVTPAKKLHPYVVFEREARESLLSSTYVVYEREARECQSYYSLTEHHSNITPPFILHLCGV